MSVALSRPVSAEAASAPASAAWSPGPGYVEVITATAWVRPSGSLFEVVVLTSAEEDGGQPALVTGTVTQDLLVLGGYWLVNPTELRGLVDAGVLDLRDIGHEHPVLAYCDTKIEQWGCGIQPGVWSALGLDAAAVAAAERAARTAAIMRADAAIEAPF